MALLDLIKAQIQPIASKTTNNYTLFPNRSLWAQKLLISLVQTSS